MTLLLLRVESTASEQSNGESMAAAVDVFPKVENS